MCVYMSVLVVTSLGFSCGNCCQPPWSCPPSPPVNSLSWNCSALPLPSYFKPSREKFTLSQLESNFCLCVCQKLPDYLIFETCSDVKYAHTHTHAYTPMPTHTHKHILLWYLNWWHTNGHHEDFPNTVLPNTVSVLAEAQPFVLLDHSLIGLHLMKSFSVLTALK